MPAGEIDFMAASTPYNSLSEVSNDIEDLPPGDVHDALVGVCPYSHGILTRAAAPFDVGFHLEQCPTCQGVWFDQGEFEVVYSFKMLRLLSSLWDPVHQAQHDQSEDQSDALEQVRERLGDELFNRITQLADDLRNHPFSADAMAYLKERVTLVSLVSNEDNS